ncbi:ORF3a [Alphamesonivirus casuarinaense]|uniref:ORF3a n=1 Tax=Alphamesonivirus casuarinaense TaxID=1945562 RepID=M4JYR8_9NIDO|nr:ORF3a [Alphamesonivirus 4]AGE00066.1 ORF3a [Alphamesonivirus 4]
MKIAIFVCLNLFALTYAQESSNGGANSTKLCEASASQHCTSMGYAYCKSVGGVQSCYCSHQQNFTSVVDVIDKDLKCSITSSKYLDPHYWFRDLLAASVTLLVIFTAITWAYLIPTYAKVDALYTNSASYKSNNLHYIPLLPRKSNGSYTIIPPTIRPRNG